MPIEDDEQTREDVIALQTAIDILPTIDSSKRVELLGNMRLILTRLQIMVDDEINGLRRR